MKKILPVAALVLLVLFFFPLGIGGQTNGNGSPTGTCGKGHIYTDNNTGNVFGCTNGTWTNLAPAAAQSNQVTDLFNRAALGTNWNQAIGSWTTTSTGPVTSGSGFSVAQYTALGTADTEDIYAVVPGSSISSGYSGIYLRSSCVAGTCSGYGLMENNATLYLAKFVGSTTASAGTVTVYNGAGSGDNLTGISNAFDELELKVTGGAGSTGVQLQAYWNRTQITREAVDTSSPLFGGYPGIGTNQANSVNSVIIRMPAPPTAAVNIVVHGDSTCEGAGIFTRWSDFITTSLKNTYVTNTCVSGQGLGTVFAAATSGNLNKGTDDGTNVVDPLIVPKAKNIAVLLEGTNDLGPGAVAASTVSGFLTSWITARHAAGWKYAIVVPVLSRCDVASYDPIVTNYDILVGQNAGLADAIVPLGQALVGRRACLTSVFNADNVHPSQYAGSDLIGPGTGNTIMSLP